MKNGVVVDIEDSERGFRFRLRNQDGRVTRWGCYRDVVMLDGVVAATEYYVPRDKALIPMSPEEFLACWAIMEGE